MAMSIAAGEQKALGGLGFGGNTVGNLMFASYFSRKTHGVLPKTQAEMGKVLGYVGPRKAKWQEMLSTPAGQAAWQAFKIGAQHGNPDSFAALGVLLESDPDEMNWVYEGSGFYDPKRPDIAARVRSNTMGISYEQALAFGSVPDTKAMPGPGAVRMPSDQLASMISTEEARNHLAPGILRGVIGAESAMGTQGDPSNPAQVVGHGPVNAAGSLRFGAEELARDYSIFSDIKDVRKREKASVAGYNLGMPPSRQL